MSWTTMYGAGKTAVIKDNLNGPASLAIPKFLNEFHKQFVKQYVR